MTKIQKHIEIVRSSILSLSSLSLKSAQAIEASLKHTYSHVSITTVNSTADLEALVVRMPDLVFSGIKYVPQDPLLGFNDPNKVWLAEYLEDAGIACTGSGRFAHELELSKDLSKQRVLDSGLSTSPFYVIRMGFDAPDLSQLTYPVFVKPSDRGGGEGIDSDSVAYDKYSLMRKANQLMNEFGADTLVEQYLSGREFSVAILKDRGTLGYTVMPVELIAPKDMNGARILSSAVKSADTESFHEVDDVILRIKLETLALDVFHALGARDYGRIDIRLDSEGTPHFLEANLIPSLIDGYGNFPKACMLNAAIGYDDMLLHIVELALTRQMPVDNPAPGLPLGLLVPLPV